MRASRLMSVLMLLQARGRMTAQQLADELEISVRTVYRDIESLGAAGVPVYADRGPAGGYQLLGGFRTRLTGLTGDEADTVFLAGVPGPAAELGLGTVLAATELKLLAALPPELRSRAGRIRERFHLDAPGWFRGALSAPHIEAVATAVWEQRVVDVHYQRWDKSEVDRTLEPLGVVLKAGAWYVVSRSAGQLRTYRVSRIRDIAVRDERFDRPDDFELAAYWEAWSERLEASMYRGEAVVRFSPRAMQLIFLLGAVVARAVRDTASEPDGAGWVQATVPTESTEHALHDLLRFGPDAEVLSPPELRERMAAAATGLATLYGG